MTKAPKELPRGAGRVAFLARVEDFRKLVVAGHPVLAIYQEHGKDLGISYSQFSRYVARYIRSPASHDQDRPTLPFTVTPTREPSKPIPAESAANSPTRAASRSTTASKPAAQIDKPAASKSGFQHRATSGDDRDDLI